MGRGSSKPRAALPIARAAAPRRKRIDLGSYLKTNTWYKAPDGQLLFSQAPGPRGGIRNNRWLLSCHSGKDSPLSLAELVARADGTLMWNPSGAARTWDEDKKKFVLLPEPSWTVMDLREATPEETDYE